VRPWPDAQRRDFKAIAKVMSAHYRVIVPEKEAERGGLAYDPRSAKAFKQGPVDDIDLWPVWEEIRSPTLVVRGAVSDLLTHAAAEEMTWRGPKAKLVELPGIGYAPALVSEDQISLTRDFLLA
jgi:pimeloyl-ACP methyl ester carboxylesterase